jgi:hypothetical protein
MRCQRRVSVYPEVNSPRVNAEIYTRLEFDVRVARSNPPENTAMPNPICMAHTMLRQVVP